MLIFLPNCKKGFSLVFCMYKLYYKLVSSKPPNRFWLDIIWLYIVRYVSINQVSDGQLCTQKRHGYGTAFFCFGNIYHTTYDLMFKFKWHSWGGAVPLLYTKTVICILITFNKKMVNGNKRMLLVINCKLSYYDI